MARDPFFIVFLPMSAIALFIGAPFTAFAGLQTFYAHDILEIDLLESARSSSAGLRL